jgi:hypothetical protein
MVIMVVLLEFGGVVSTQKVPVIAIMNQYALLWLWMDMLYHLLLKQDLQGSHPPLHRHWLGVFAKCVPHCRGLMDPTIIDHKFKEDEPWGNDGQLINGNKYLIPFDDFGNYCHHVVVLYTDLFQQKNCSIDLDDIIDQCVYYTHQPFVDEHTVAFYDAHEHEIKSYNDDDIQVPSIMAKITTKQETDFDYDLSKTVCNDLK